MRGWFARPMPVVGSAVCLAMSLVTATPAAAVTPSSGTAAVSVTAPAAPRIPITDREVRRLLGDDKDDVSFSVRDRRTGATYVYNGDMRNCTGSIVKVLVLATLVHERREDGRGLSASQRRLAERMIRFSDNDATTALYRQAGGRYAVQAMAKRLGMSRTTMAGSWGRTSTSAADQRLLMDKLVDGTPHLSKADRRYILDLMGRVTPEQRWGVGSVPSGTSVAVKNGWVPLSPRGWRVNSIGSVEGAGRDYTLAILSYDNSSMDAGVALNRTISGLVWRKLGAKTSGAAAAVQMPEGVGQRFWIRPGAAVPPHPLH